MTHRPSDRIDAPPVDGSSKGEIAWGVCAMVTALLVAVWALNLWSWEVGTPWGLEGDSTFVAMQLRDIADQGWYWRNSDLGFPFGQNGSLFPELNVVHVLFVKMLGLFFSDPYSPGVAYFVLGFPAAAGSMYALARSQGLSRWAGVMSGVLFAFAPGHQERFGHLWLAAYWVVPMGIWVVLQVLRGSRMLGRREGVPGLRGWLHPRSLLTWAALTIVGLSGVYYFAFTLLLLGFSAVVARWRSGRAKGWAPGLMSAAYMTAVFSIPLILARVGAAGETVTGTVPATRSFADSELFAGKLMDLLLPWQGHILEPLAFLTFAYNVTDRATAETAALGVVALSGWFALGFVAVKPLVSDSLPDSDLRRWSSLSIVTTAFYIVGGLGSFVALFFAPQIRTWSRLSLYLMVFGLLAVGWWITRLARMRGLALSAIVAVLLTVLGVLDQVNPERAPDHLATAARFDAVQKYARDLQLRTGAACPVFQLPVVPFPETAGIGEMNGYDQLLPYLASDDLKFSVGAMRGTAAADWQLAVNLTDVRELERELAAAGFCALELDTEGFTPETTPQQRIEAALGAPAARSTDGTFVAWALAGGEAPSLRQRLLQPVVVSLDAYQLRDEAGEAYQFAGSDVPLRVSNMSQEVVPITVSMEVTAQGFTDRHLTLVDDSGREMLDVSLPADSRISVRVAILAPPGTSRLHLQISGETVRLSGAELPVSARVARLKATTTSDVRVATLQQQVLDGIVVR